MAYRLQEHESVPEGIRRIAIEQLDDALAQLRDRVADDADEAVHDARKDLKKLRAVLRLVRGAIPSDTYHQENVCYRDAGRLLSDVRDANVQIETLDDLTEHFSESVSSDAFSETRAALVVRHRQIRDRILYREGAIEQAIPMLEAARGRIEDWSRVPDDWSAFSGGLKQVYKRGYKDLPAAISEPTMENFHEWRKRVKYLWYHLRILHPIWPGMMEEMAAQTKQLSDYLGDEHDLAMLWELLREQPELAGDPTEFEALVALIDRRRTELQRSATLLGRRIYAEQPKDFRDRIQTYWQVWQVHQHRPVLVEV